MSTPSLRTTRVLLGIGLGATFLISTAVSGPLGTVALAGNANYAPLPETPWYVNDLPGMPTPFRGPLKIDVSRHNAQVVRAHNPDANPPGANDWNCRPTKEHPLPVILVHGTTDLPSSAWNAGAPLLKNAGYCVFTIAYGRIPGEPDGAIAPIEDSAAELSRYVQRVLHATGTLQVLMAGHSQGGSMPFYYMNFLDGWRYVKHFVAISPSINGTDAFGLARIPGLADTLRPVIEQQSHPAQADQLTGSAFLKKLHSRPLTRPEVLYSVIATRYDDVVTPYNRQLLPPAPNVTNIVVQDRCATNFSDHYSNVYDVFTLNYVLQEFDPRYREEVPCGMAFPYFGGYLPALPASTQ